MKNWGVRIALIYGTFVVGILTMVGMAMNQKTDLVSSDYYAKELKFQEQIDHSANGQNLDIRYELNKSSVTLHFPVEFYNREISGTILFFKPSDSEKDVQFPIVCNTEGTQVIQSDKLSRGMYKMKMNWESNHKKYYHEKTVVLD